MAVPPLWNTSPCDHLIQAYTDDAFLARVVTDYATFAWLCVVFIVDDYRGQGLGKWLIETITAQPVLQPTLFLLATRDAHGLYEQYGDFEPLPVPERWMVHRRSVT